MDCHGSPEILQAGILPQDTPWFNAQGTITADKVFLGSVAVGGAAVGGSAALTWALVNPYTATTLTIAAADTAASVESGVPSPTSVVSSEVSATVSTVTIAEGEASLVLIKDGQVAAQQPVGSLLSHAEFAAQNGAVASDGSLAAGYWVGTVGKVNGNVIGMNSMTFYGNQMPNAAATIALRSTFHEPA
jgi:hypothetical protein